MSKLCRLIQRRARSSAASVAQCPFAVRDNQETAPTPDQRLVEQKVSDNVRPFEEIPGPGGLYSIPFLGTVLQLKPFTNFSVQNIFQLLQAYNKQYGPIAKARMGADYNVYLFDPDDIEMVFRNDKKHPYRIELPLTRTMQRRTGIPAALGTLQDEEWRKRRRPLQNLVQRPQVLSKYIPHLSDIADMYMDKLKNQEKFPDIFRQLMEFTSEGVGYLCFNRALGNINGSFSNEQTDILFHTTNYLEHLGEQFFRLPLYKLFKTPIYNSFVKSYKFIYNFTKDEIEKYKQRHPRSDRMDEKEDITFLSGLLKDDSIPEDEVVTSIVDVFVGGIDSTASAMTFLMYHLASNPEKQEKLYEEVRNFADQQFTSDTLQQLPYLKACLKESFRLIYPVPGGTVRVLDKDIDVKGYRINKGTSILLLSGVTCLDEKYFKDPEEFIPERWLRGGDRDQVNPFAHLPFGYGARNCLGQRFAEAQIYLLTAKMFGKYKFSLPEGVTSIPYRYTAFPVPLKPVTMLIEER